MEMELRQLRYFVAVAREQNFTRAAERLNIAQPPLSRQIQQLEHEVGVKLIERGSRPVRLTDAGKLFYDQAVQALEHIEQMTGLTRRLAATARTRVGFGFVASTLYGYLPEVIRRYRVARPEVELTLHEMTSLEQIVALKEGRIDARFGRKPSPRQCRLCPARGARRDLPHPDEHAPRRPFAGDRPDPAYHKAHV